MCMSVAGVDEWNPHESKRRERKDVIVRSVRLRVTSIIRTADKCSSLCLLFNPFDLTSSMRKLNLRCMWKTWTWVLRWLDCCYLWPRIVGHASSKRERDGNSLSNLFVAMTMIVAAVFVDVCLAGGTDCSWAIGLALPPEFRHTLEPRTRPSLWSFIKISIWNLLAAIVIVAFNSNDSDY